MRLLWEEGPGPGPASDKVFYPCTRRETIHVLCRCYFAWGFNPYYYRTLLLSCVMTTFLIK